MMLYVYFRIDHTAFRIDIETNYHSGAGGEAVSTLSQLLVVPRMTRATDGGFAERLRSCYATIPPCTSQTEG